MALMNRHLEPTLETVFMMPAEQYTYLSSRLIKECSAWAGKCAGPGATGRRRVDEKKQGSGSRDRSRSRVMFAQRLAQVSESATMKVAAEAEKLRRAGHDVVDFSVGEPDFPTPEHIKAAAKDALDKNFTRYTAVAGIPELREAICARYKADYGVSITPLEVLATFGGKQALYNAALALMNPGDEVITHAPYWPTIPEQVKLVDAQPVIVQTHWQDSFAVHADKIIAAITPKTKAIILNSPSNPTGCAHRRSAVAAIADAAAKRGIWIIVDLCYEHLIYEDVPHNLPKCCSTVIASGRYWPVRRRRRTP
jgi:aspartate aminotransferase